VLILLIRFRLNQLTFCFLKLSINISLSGDYLFICSLFTSIKKKYYFLLYANIILCYFEEFKRPRINFFFEHFTQNFSSSNPTLFYSFNIIYINMNLMHALDFDYIKMISFLIYLSFTVSFFLSNAI
jgi:hypothetical protein